MHNVVRRMSWAGENRAETEPLLTCEWLVANGLGSYASGTVAGVLTRRYHGLLIAALPAPIGCVVMLSHLSEQLRFAKGNTVQIGGAEHAQGELDLPVSHCLIDKAGMIRHAVVTADWRIRPDRNDTLARLKQVVADQ